MCFKFEYRSTGGALASVCLFSPMYPLVQPENYLFISHKLIFKGWKHARNAVFNCENKNAVVGISEFASADTFVNNDVSFYNSTASTWTLGTPRSAWKLMSTLCTYI